MPYFPPPYDRVFREDEPSRPNPARPPSPLPSVFDMPRNPYPSVLQGTFGNPNYVPPTPREMLPQLTSMAMDVVPGVGDVKSAQEAITGKNLITGEKLGTVERVLSGVGALPFVPNVAGLMGGKLAKYAPKGLDAAKKMAEMGHNEDTIWQRTGWRSDPKGNWAFEIDDSSMNLLMDVRSKTHGDETTLGKFIKHDKLFDQYPDLRKMRVKFMNMGSEAGSFSKNPMTGETEIYVNPIRGNPKETIIHEIQHYIQDIEGWPKGGSPDFGLTVEAKKVFDEISKPVRAQYEKAKLEGNTALADELQRKLMMDIPQQANMIAYRNLYGEFQARDSASRLSWDAERRKMVRPYSSEMEPKEGWIYKGGQGNAKMASAGKDITEPASPAKLTRDIQSEPGFVYHATNAERLQDIADSGALKTHRPGEFTDQSVWPDGAREKRAYFSGKADVTWSFAPEEGMPVIVRSKSQGLKTESTGDIYSTKPIKAKDLEYFGNDGKWHPVSDLTRASVGKVGEYPLAKELVDNRTVRKEVPNLSSISASLKDYTVLPGIREVPMDVFELTGKHYSVEGNRRIANLAEQIKESGEINPLIVVIDEEGPYILEGSTRADALKRLNAKSFPALVVKDNESLAKASKK